MLAEKRRSKAVVGSAKPRLAPPIPARSDITSFRDTAADLGITLRPWQEVAARYLMATGPDGFPLYREVAIVVARQNGKTTLAKPFIVDQLKAGRKIMHIAQTRELPRTMFRLLAGAIPENLLLKQRGKGGKMHTIWPRSGSGQEEILLGNDGSYRIAAANRGGARGFTNDKVIVDELREMETHDGMEAVESTVITSPWAQIVYFSNAGTEDSVVLNALRERAGKDPSLAYLEWSAAPERSPDDHDGWLEANPSIGHDPVLLGNLERGYERHRLGGTMASFETENLCRWVRTMREPLVDIGAWNLCAAESLPPGKRPVMGVSLDPAGTGAAAALSWQQPDGSVALRLLLRATGSPIDVSALGADLRDLAAKHHVARVAFDPMTDAELAKHFTTTEPVGGLKFANASAQFVNLITASKLRHVGCAAVGDDLTWTARKAHEETGRFSAVRANDDHPIPAVLSAIRAVWLASGPRPPRPRIY